MFIPTKHENLHKSTIVLGADIIKSLKKREYNVEDLFQELKKIFEKDISLTQYYNTLTFLWLTDVVELNDFNLSLRK
jgi:Fe2+ or Zn2+ uptake regulation protein